MSRLDSIVVWYEKATWLRALVQIPPGGGSVDVLLAGRAASLNQQRLDELIRGVNQRLESLEQLNEEFLGSEEFFELFRRTAEIVAHSSSAEKRRLLADYLAGRVQGAGITDIGLQVLEDLRLMQPVHIEVLTALPQAEGSAVDMRQPPVALPAMPHFVYEKVMSDLERLGFLRYSAIGIGTYGGGGGRWETTGYVRVFFEHIGRA